LENWNPLIFSGFSKERKSWNSKKEFYSANIPQKKKPKHSQYKNRSYLAKDPKSSGISFWNVSNTYIVQQIPCFILCPDRFSLQLFAHASTSITHHVILIFLDLFLSFKRQSKVKISFSHAFDTCEGLHLIFNNWSAPNSLRRKKYRSGQREREILGKLDKPFKSVRL